MTAPQSADADRLVIGLDVGGSTTRVLVADLTGRVLGTARGGGGNPVSNGTEAAAREIGGAVRAALAGLDPTRVEAGVIGLAGGLVASPELSALWPATGLTVPPRLVSDAELAYTAGTSEPSGTVLISGTGAVAADVRDHELIRTADGHGWLLGDRGSGFWLGREAVSATLTEVDRLLPVVLDADAPPARLPGLAGAVAEALLGERGLGVHPRAALITAAHAEPPARLARLAPLVLDHAAAGDPVAAALLERAADLLLETLALIREPASDLPIVLAGGILSADTPLTPRLRTRLAARWPDAPLTHARNGAGAAAWLAARTLGHGTEKLHAELTA
ncbi:BadF/BadG/BcrA/BcrD ATPase family protein [Kitasatospora sp. NPDC049285]|uniref:N-acetylglucosamine kinase n=1 Tax=Kitasatospora sp. NPDC049285 TaxID=3157096 RepID=UPI00343ED6EF